MAPDDWEKLDVIYKACIKHSKPIIFHAGMFFPPSIFTLVPYFQMPICLMFVLEGQEPSSPAYKCDTYKVCGADKIERVLLKFPDLKLCIPHLGAAEFEAYFAMAEKYVFPFSAQKKSKNRKVLIVMIDMRIYIWIQQWPSQTILKEIQ